MKTPRLPSSTRAAAPAAQPGNGPGNGPSNGPSNGPGAEPAEFRSWIRGLRFSSFSIVMIGILTLGVFIISPSLSIYLNQRQEISALEASVAQRQKALDRANTEKERWQDPAYVRSEARNRLFYVMPGENQLLIIDDVEIATGEPAGASTELKKTDTDWVKTLGYSLVTAGTTTADSAALDPANPDPATTGTGQ